MSDDQFVTDTQVMALACRAMTSVDFDAVAARCARTESLGPVLDPTRYQHEGEQYRVLGEAARHAAAFRASMQQVLDLVAAEEERARG